MKSYIFFISLFFNTILCAQNGIPEVGSEYQGGIIFYKEGDHGLIVAKKDLSEEYIWDEAIFECDRLEVNGYKGWRLPNNAEWIKLYLFWKQNPEFRKTMDIYSSRWSSTPGGQKEGKMTAYIQVLTDGSQMLVQDRNSDKFASRPIRSF
jgi:hypothetical protein